MSYRATMREILEGWARACPSNFVYDSVRIQKKEGRISLRRKLTQEKKALMRALMKEIRKEIWLGLDIQDSYVKVWYVEPRKKKKR